MADPGGSAGQSRVQPVLGLCLNSAVEAGVSVGDRVLGVPGGGAAEDELAAVPVRPTTQGLVDAWRVGRRSTRSERIRPRISTGMSRSNQATRGAS